MILTVYFIYISGGVRTKEQIWLSRFMNVWVNRLDDASLYNNASEVSKAYTLLHTVE